MKFRPIKPSDEDMMRRLFYQFLGRIEIPPLLRPHTDHAAQGNAGIRQHRLRSTRSPSSASCTKDRSEEIIAEARYSYYPREKTHELAFIVEEDYQGKGIASFLVDYLLKIAKERGLKSLCATVLPENKKMLGVFDKSSVEHTAKYSDGVIAVNFKLQ